MTVTFSEDEYDTYLHTKARVLELEREVKRLKEVASYKAHTAGFPIREQVTTKIESTEPSLRMSWKPWLSLLHATATKNPKSKRTIDNVIAALPSNIKVTRSQVANKLRTLGYIVDYKSGKVFNNA